MVQTGVNSRGAITTSTLTGLHLNNFTVVIYHISTSLYSHMVIHTTQATVLFCFTFVVLAKAGALLLTRLTIWGLWASTLRMVTITLVIVTIGRGIVLENLGITLVTLILGVPFL
jgi:hypothetical protein